ncbi:unnamed protein product [Orchesella dallaii]|uniref:Peptidoglycan binding-like domain-containing protein n=1 Tax=Orchesella dallaii TaxID=48710 RepID=A0ABP1RYZ3_9HEXA
MTHVITKFNNESSPQSKSGEKFKIRNKFGIFISLLILNLLVTISNAAPVFTSNDAMAYFEKYGWLNRNSLQKESGPQSMMDMRTLIKEFQAFSGIPVTGELDEKTVEAVLVMFQKRFRNGDVFRF